VVVARFVLRLTSIFRRDNFARDMLAGVTVGVIAVPQSMSYATVAGLPAKYGLYNSMIGLLLYPVFGTSPHLITGPTAVMSILVSGLVIHFRIQLLSLLSLLLLLLLLLLFFHIMVSCVS